MTLTERIEALAPWFQRVTFPDGTEVGCWCTRETVERLTQGIGMTGTTVLDVGCMAGAMALYCEERGARVTGTEPDDHYRKQATLVREAFGASFTIHDWSIYEAPSGLCSDVVLMSGVYYHLQHPLLGLQNAWQNTGGVLCIEGEIMPGREPVAQFIPGAYKGDGSNWWVPTERCLLDWCGTLGGEIENLTTAADRERDRALVRVWRRGR
jgi:SAM-dependent methyltransferase